MLLHKSAINMVKCRYSNCEIIAVSGFYTFLDECAQKSVVPRNVTESGGSTQIKVDIYGLKNE